MFNGSSNIVIQGGTFIIAGSIDSASLKEMGANTPQNSPTASNTGQEPTTDQFSYTQEANAQEFCKPHVDQFDPVPRSYSADNFETSVHASGQVPKYGPFFMLTPSIIDEGPTTDSDQFSYTQAANSQESCKSHVDQFDSFPRSRSVDNFEISVHASRQEPEYGPFPMPTPSITGDASRRNAKPNVESHAAPPPFPMPSYFSNSQYGAHAHPIQFRRRQPTCPPSQSGHSQFGASPTPSRHPVRASTCPYPSPSFPIPQLVPGAYYI